MGYTTDFAGHFNVDPPLTEAHRAYLDAFASIRHMTRDPNIADLLTDPIRDAAGLPIGENGIYYVGSAYDGNFGQNHDESVTKDTPPPGIPGYWCQWIPTVDGTAIEWDGNEKFYEYVDWLDFLIHHFLTPWGYELSGQVQWQGEDPNDRGMIMIVPTNKIRIGTYQGRYVFDDPEAAQRMTAA